MKYDPVVEPVILPLIFFGNTTHHRRQPFRQRVVKFGYIDILGGKPEIAGEHQRGAAVNRDLQPGSGLHRRAADLVECVEQRVAAEGCTHRAPPHENSAPSPRIIGMKSGKLVAMKAVSSTLTGLSAPSPITSAAIAMR